MLLLLSVAKCVVIVFPIMIDLLLKLLDSLIRDLIKTVSITG